MEHETVIAALTMLIIGTLTGWLVRSARSTPTHSKNEQDEARRSDVAVVSGLSTRLLQVEALSTFHGTEIATLKANLDAMSNKLDMILGLMTKRKG